MRWHKTLLSSFLFAWPLVAQATLSVTPSGVSNPVRAGQAIYYAVQKYVNLSGTATLVSPTDSAVTGCPAAIDQGFQIFDVTKNRYAEVSAGVSTNRLELLVSSTSSLAASSGSVLVAMARVTNGSTSKFVPIASVNGLSCYSGATCYKAGQSDISGKTSQNHYYAVPFSSSGTILGFYLADVCSDAYNQLSSTVLTGCEVSADPSYTANPSSGSLSLPESVPAASSSPISLEILITEINPSANTAPTAAARETLTTQIYTVVNPPQMSACNVAANGNLYYPGDTKIYIDTTAFSMTGCSGNSTLAAMGSAPYSTLIGVANSLPTDPDVTASFRTNNTIVDETSSGGFGQLGGFTNATSVSDHQYNMSFLMRNAAGLLAPPPGVTDINTNVASWAASDSQNCLIPGVQTSAINGLIAENRCFIATSAFGRDPDSRPVALLREFRDQWLEKSLGGRALVRTYYRYSPRIAEVMDGAPILRLVALKLLVPAEIVAWTFVRLPMVATFLLTLGIGLILIGVLRTRRGMTLTLVLLLLAQLQNAARAEPSSYTEEMKALLDPKESSEGYTQREREKISSADESNFIQSVQPHLENKEGAEGYSQKLRETLPQGEGAASRPSVTAKTSAEEKPLEPRYAGDIHFAGGVRYSVFASRAVSGGNNNFQPLYLDTYVPEVAFFGEWQPFHSEWFGNLGLIASFGISVFRGNGIYDVSGLVNPLSGSAFPDASRTKMILNLVPVTFGVIYRFNLLRLLRPYVAASGVAYGMLETRDDGIAAKRSFGFGTLLEGGISLLLDWFEPGKAWDAYASSGIRHTYLTAEYAILAPLYGDLRYSNSGFQAGLAFEF